MLNDTIRIPNQKARKNTSDAEEEQENRNATREIKTTAALTVLKKRGERDSTVDDKHSQREAECLVKERSAECGKHAGRRTSSDEESYLLGVRWWGGCATETGWPLGATEE